VTGIAEVGQTLTASRGTWLNSPTYYATRWQRATSAGWSAIAGATYDSYTPTAADAGLQLRAVVTATNADGSVLAASDPTATVPGGASLAPTPSPTPVAPPAPRIRRITSASAWLTVTAGSPRGKRLGRVAFAAPSDGRVSTRALRVKRPSGRYVVQLCTTGSTPVCTTKTLRARSGRLSIPALKLRTGSGLRVHLALSLNALSRRATAMTRGSVALDV
jgi:hypothetical protein